MDAKLLGVGHLLSFVCACHFLQMTPFVDGRQVDLYSLYKDVEERGEVLPQPHVLSVALTPVLHVARDSLRTSAPAKRTLLVFCLMCAFI